jgi:hypothetical protein
MQKVVGSSPIIRLKQSPASAGLFVAALPSPITSGRLVRSVVRFGQAPLPRPQPLPPPRTRTATADLTNIEASLAQPTAPAGTAATKVSGRHHGAA